MLLRFQPLDEANACSIANWRYDAPYDFYNLNPDEVEQNVRYLTDPQNAFYSILNEHGQLIGYCSFSTDGQVPGGDYHEEALDIGLGIHPDFTGQGNGEWYIEQILDFARRRFTPRQFRVTVAAFNKRAQLVFQRLNFRVNQSFQRERDRETFFILVRHA